MKNETKKYINYTPAVDVMEQKDGWQMYFDMPGVSNEMLDVQVEDQILTVNAETDLAENGMAVKYERSFQLSDEVDAPAIKATLTNGVLSLMLPKAASAKVHKIDVLSA